MTFEISAVGPEEAGSLLPLLGQVQAIHVEAQPDRFHADAGAEERLTFLRDWLSSDGVVALVARDPGGTAIGYLIFEVQERPATVLTHAQRRGMLHHVAVDQAWRRGGIGLALIAEMRARLKAQGIERVAVIYGTFNLASAALMRQAGFEPVNVIAEGPV